ncbi:putative deoxyribonuclease TATDN3 isoform X2 [Latimeria chalumnae]|uniref:putative deoxyribonuclease TATDN3 isoform X2 n=1 Tax=Latimeria chalumnae TaxID=7897 RepID=UPI00313ECEC1
MWRGGFVDCHCHLSARDFQEDVEEVIEQAKQSGVAAIVAVAEYSEEFERIIELSNRYHGFVMPCLGVHPVQGLPPQDQRGATLQDLQSALPLIEKYKDQLIAIGEVGLDFTPRFASTDAQKEEQRQVFIQQIEIAKKLDLPLNVHSRSAGRPTINLLKEQGAEKVLLHAFDGKPSVAMEGVKAGYYFSIPPSIVRSEQQKLVKQLPLDSICLETDSPALGPEKQVRNVPKNISISAEYVAKVKGVPVEKVIEATQQNALTLFPKLQKFLRL